MKKLTGYYDSKPFSIGPAWESKIPFWIGIAGLILMLIIALAERTVN